MPDIIRFSLNIVLFIPVVIAVVYTQGQVPRNSGLPEGRSRELVADGTTAAMAFSSDGSLFAAGGSKNTVKVWNAVSWRMTSEFKQSEFVADLLFAPSSNIIATINNDRAKGGKRNATILFWDVQSGKNISEYREDERSRGITSIAYSPSGRQMAVGFGEGLVKLLDVEHPKDIRILNDSLLSLDSGISSLSFSPDGKLLAVATGHGVSGPSDSTRLTIVNIASGRAMFTDRAIQVHGLAFSPDGKFLALGISKAGKLSVSTTVMFFNTINWKVERELKDHSPEELEFSANGDTLISADSDSDSSTIAVWDMKAQRIKRWIHHDGMIASLAISPDATLVAAGSDNGKIRIYPTSKRSTK